jgi:hypothetical protein
MGGGGGGGGSDAVDYQRQQEEARQARIRQGMQQIDEMFNGKQVTTTTPTGAAINPNATGIGNGTYYDANGTAYTLNNGNSGNLRWAGTSAPGVQGPGGRVQYRVAPGQTYIEAGNTRHGGEAADPTPTKKYKDAVWADLPDQLYSGVDSKTTTEGGYGEDYYQKRATAYNDFALPQLQEQYKDQQKALTYALARGGNLGSSLASQKSGALDKDYALQQQSVYDTGQDYANKARSDVATNKQNLVQLLQASADPDAVANIAQSQAATMSQMPNFSPLAPVMTNVAGSLGTYLQNQQTADAIKKAYSDPYSNPINRSSGKVG